MGAGSSRGSTAQTTRHHGTQDFNSSFAYSHSSQYSRHVGSRSTPFPVSKNPAPANSESVVSAPLVEAKSTFKNEARESESPEKEYCLICFEEYTDQNPKIPTRCCHHYHLSCIYEWMGRSKTCPVCRQEMIWYEKA